MMMKDVARRARSGKWWERQARSAVGDRFTLKVTGVRAKMLLNPQAPFALARQFHREGLALADVFTFASGLYFRGKLAYARRFASSDGGRGMTISWPRHKDAHAKALRGKGAKEKRSLKSAQSA